MEAVAGLSGRGPVGVKCANLALAPLVDCSPGELRRVAVARALIRVCTDPPEVRLLLADEPTAHLDAVGARAGVRATRSPACADGWPCSSPATMRSWQWRLPRTGRLTRAGPPPLSVTVDRRIASRRTRRFPRAGRPGRLRRPLRRHRTPRRERHPRDRPRRGTLGAPCWKPCRGKRGAKGGAACCAGSRSPSWRLWPPSGLTGVSGWLIVTASHQPPVLHLMVAIVGVRTFGIGRAVLRYAERLAVHDAVLRWRGILRDPAVGRVVHAAAELGAAHPFRGGPRTSRRRGRRGARRRAARAGRRWGPGSSPGRRSPLAIGLWGARGASGRARRRRRAAFVALPLAVLAVERRSSVAVTAHRLWLGERVAHAAGRRRGPLRERCRGATGRPNAFADRGRPRHRGRCAAPRGAVASRKRGPCSRPVSPGAVAAVAAVGLAHSG